MKKVYLLLVLTFSLNAFADVQTGNYNCISNREGSETSHNIQLSSSSLTINEGQEFQLNASADNSWQQLTHNDSFMTEYKILKGDDRILLIFNVNTLSNSSGSVWSYIETLNFKLSEEGHLLNLTISLINTTATNETHSENFSCKLN